MSVYTVSLRDTSNLGQVNVGDGTLLANLSVAAGRGPKGDGWTGVTYDENTGTFIFTSNDGLAYTSPDVRPEVDLDNVDINSGTIDGTVIGGTNPAAASFTQVDLKAIAESKAVTAVDVFVYDTSKDSDGGAWRKRTQATSWYNETLNTATRGARKEFPAVAVIVAEDDTVTIYDGDDPALPMWMVFNETDGIWGNSSGSATSISIRNGTLCMGKDSNQGLSVWNFLSDIQYNFDDSIDVRAYGSIAERNTDNSSSYSIYSTERLVDDTIKDVAMTVLPDAPIDAATGLPVPTIAVATAGGVSVIKDDGTVTDSASTSNTLFLSFSDEGLWYGYDTSFSFATNADFLAGDGFGDITASTNGNYALDLKIRWRKEMFTFGNTLVGGGGLVPKQGFEQFSLDYNDFSNSMKSETTSNFATGWQHGDIKGAFLSSTDTTSLVVGAELVTNGTFDTDTTGWTPKNANTTLSVVGNKLSVSTDGETGYAYQAITTVAGQTYRLTGDADETTGASYASIFVGISVGSSALGSHTVTGIDTGLSITFVATSTTTYITLYNTRTTPVSYALFDNISVTLADADRSVNNNGLTINGTITRTPVATDADLVGYSGFSASNYLEQPYNSDLDFGTGDFCVMGWVKESAGSDWLIDRMEGRDGSSNLWGFDIWQSGLNLRFDVYENNLATNVISATEMANGSADWYFFTAVRRSGVLEMYMQGKLDATTSGTARDVSYTSTGTAPPLTIGARTGGSAPWQYGSAALLRISATAPTAEQIAKIYNDEKFLFQENAQATLYGTSDAVTALAHDDATNLLHVGTNAGRSVFQGLRRVSNTTTVVATTISASNGLVVEE